MITTETLAKLSRVLSKEEWYVVENAIMRQAFDEVAPKDDWRDPIDATVFPNKFSPQVLASAVEYMTSTAVLFSENARGQVRVRAAGYRAGPAGP
jgi:hypothetical protein